MKPFLRYFAFCSVLFSGVVCATEGASAPKSYKGTTKHIIVRDKPASVKSEGTSSWKFWYIAKGTRSEGLHGILVINGKVTHGKAIGDERDALGQKYVWYGTWDSRKTLFSKSGWLPVNLSAVYPSWKIPKHNKSE